MTIRELFTVHGLGAHVDAFEREEVAVSDLAELRDDDLRTHFGVTGFMDRKRFHAMVASLKEDAGAPATRALDAGATRWMRHGRTTERRGWTRRPRGAVRGRSTPE